MDQITKEEIAKLDAIECKARSIRVSNKPGTGIEGMQTVPCCIIETAADKREVCRAYGHDHAEARKKAIALLSPGMKPPTHEDILIENARMKQLLAEKGIAPPGEAAAAMAGNPVRPLSYPVNPDQRNVRALHNALVSRGISDPPVSKRTREYPQQAIELLLAWDKENGFTNTGIGEDDPADPDAAPLDTAATTR